MGSGGSLREMPPPRAPLRAAPGPGGRWQPLTAAAKWRWLRRGEGGLAPEARRSRAAGSGGRGRGVAARPHAWVIPGPTRPPVGTAWLCQALGQRWQCLSHVAMRWEAGAACRCLGQMDPFQKFGSARKCVNLSNYIRPLRLGYFQDKRGFSIKWKKRLHFPYTVGKQCTVSLGSV